MMTEYVKAAWQRFVAFLLVWRGNISANGNADAQPVEVVEAQHTDTALMPEPAPARRPRGKVDEYGEFYFRDTILDQLDRYFRIIQRMKRRDPDAWTLYRQVGAQVLPENQQAAEYYGGYEQLIPWWQSHRPAFGMVMYGASKDTKPYDNSKRYFVPHAIHFTRYKHGHEPIKVQPVNMGDVYNVSVYWDRLGDPKRKYGSPTEFAVVLLPNGGANVLKVLHDCSKRVRAKRGGGTFVIPQRRWGHDEFFVDWAKQHGSEPEQYLRAIFVEAANTWAASANSMVRIKARKGSMIAVFSVNILRTPYFFRDRDVTVLIQGRRRPIFHIVRTHGRALKDGRVVPVRTHFRGERKFEWNGYTIEITIPGWHHYRLSEFDVGLADSETLERGPDLIGAHGLGKMLVDWEKRQVGGRINGWTNARIPERRISCAPQDDRV